MEARVDFIYLGKDYYKHNLDIKYEKSYEALEEITNSDLYNKLILININDFNEENILNFIKTNSEKFAFLLIIPNKSINLELKNKKDIILETITSPIDSKLFEITYKYLSMQLKNIDSDIFKKMVQTSINGITLIDASKNNFPIIYVNPAFEKMTGYTKEELLNKDYSLLMRYNNQLRKIAYVMKSIEKNAECKVLLKNFKKDGTMFYNEISFIPCNDISNNSKLYIGIHKDVTAIVSYKEELKSKIKKQIGVIERKDREFYEMLKLKSIDNLMENLSHQWRQRLNLITIGASAIKLEKEHEVLEDEKLYSYINTIIDNSYKLSELLNKFSYNSNSNKELSLISMQSEIQKAIKAMNYRLGNTNIKILTDLKNEPIMKNLEIDSIVNLVITLLDNSIDCLLDRNVENPWIKINLCIKNDKINLSIEDNGGGIKEQEDINDVFLPYSTTKHKAIDVGLNLHAVYKSVIYSMNGKISVRNTNNGAKFTIILDN